LNGKVFTDSRAQQEAPPAAETQPPSSSGVVVVEERVVSRPGARVVERVYVLSEGAERRLKAQGKIPPR
jgi:hypothetical protein